MSGSMRDQSPPAKPQPIRGIWMDTRSSVALAATFWRHSATASSDRGNRYAQVVAAVPLVLAVRGADEVGVQLLVANRIAIHCRGTLGWIVGNDKLLVRRQDGIVAAGTGRGPRGHRDDFQGP